VTQSRQCTLCGGKGYFELSDGSKEKCKGMGNPQRYEVIQHIGCYLNNCVDAVYDNVNQIKRELEKLKQL
jgi:hypothetical protein